MGYLTLEHAVICISECQYQARLLILRKHGWYSGVRCPFKSATGSLYIFSFSIKVGNTDPFHLEPVECRPFPVISTGAVSFSDSNILALVPG